MPALRMFVLIGILICLSGCVGLRIDTDRQAIYKDAFGHEVAAGTDIRRAIAFYPHSSLLFGVSTGAGWELELQTDAAWIDKLIVQKAMQPLNVPDKQALRRFISSDWFAPHPMNQYQVWESHDSWLGKAYLFIHIHETTSKERHVYYTKR